MSLIKCPECKRKVSNKADACPKCGFSVKDYTPTQQELDWKKKNKKRIKKWLIITVAVITSVFVICGGIGIGYSIWYDYKEQKEYNSKYPLFTDSNILQVDPYGLSNENNIIGLQISTILRGYAENEDYTISTEEDYTSYTFSLPSDIYPIGNDTELVLYTSNGIIFKVEYTFRLPQSSTISTRLANKRMRDSLTNYYDVDPIYAGYNFDDDEYVIMTKDEFGSLPDSAYYDVTFITWKNTKGMAILSFTNMFDEKSEYGAVTFTNDEIKKEEYQNYIDKYNLTL